MKKGTQSMPKLREKKKGRGTKKVGPAEGTKSRKKSFKKNQTQAHHRRKKKEFSGRWTRGGKKKQGGI